MAESRRDQTRTLLKLAENVDLFHDSETTAYADIEVDGHRETWPIRDRTFRRWLEGRYFEDTDGTPFNEAIEEVLSLLEARALYRGPKRKVFVRVGTENGLHYIDLCDELWRAVEIGPNGWSICDRPPIRFRRTRGMEALPIPIRGGSVDDLRATLNLENERDYVLTIGWLLAALRSEGPYPVLVLTGEQGSAKSSFMRFVRALVDPNKAALRALPRDERELFIAAGNAHVLAFDNISFLPSWMSDAFCRVSTGASFAARRLYSDQDEVLIEATRPIMLNGIDEFVVRPDLADRAVLLALPPISDARRLPAQDVQAAFEAVRPRILGALLDAFAGGLRRLPDTHLEASPRMADFARWVAACEPVILPAGTFATAYRCNRQALVEDAIESDSVATAVRALMRACPEWSGTATDLLTTLTPLAKNDGRTGKKWPTSPRILSNRLKRLATFLRRVGINAVWSRDGHGSKRFIHLVAAPE